MSVIRITKKFSLILSRHQKIRIIELAVLMIIGGFLEMCSVSMVIPFMNAALDPENTMEQTYIKWFCSVFDIRTSKSFLVFAAIIIALVYIVKNVYLLFEFNFQYRFVYRNMYAMQSRLLNNIIHRPYEFFLKADSGEIIRIVNNDTPDTFTALSTLISLYTELIVSGMLIFTVFIITPEITVCMAILMALFVVFINKAIKPVLGKLGTESQKAAAGMNKWLLQSVQGIKELKVMNKEEFFQRSFDRYGRVCVEAARKSNILNVTPRFLIESISMGTLFLAVALLIYRGNELELMVPMMSAVAMAAIRLLPSVNRISSYLASIAYMESRLDQLIANLKEFSGKSLVSLADDFRFSQKRILEQKVPVLKKCIEFKRVCYRYPGMNDDVLKNASLRIEAGDSVGIVGSSGAGKTTAADIMLGLLHPQSGEIDIDGIDIGNDVSGWISQIGYIPQMIFMLDGSIRENVAFGIADEDISEEHIWKALKQASLDDFVKTLPEGLDTQIGERGIRLSGGQRQRVGIARALYRNPSVLVFDEATSALDNETEAAIMESIHKLHGVKTMIIIAHRLSTIDACDHIYRVESKKIILER